MKRLAPTLILLALILVPASASADGLPLPVEGADDASVADIDGRHSYAAVSNGGQTTVLKIAADGGQILRSRTIPGNYSVPLVAYDATASGLSADGEHLVLIRPRPAFPRKTTDLLMLDTADLRPGDPVHLRGDFSFDAVSPDGRRLYLIHYQSSRNPLDYEVRAYGVVRGKLLQEPIVDPEKPNEQMAGFPMTRMQSVDGRWAYTLYAGGEETFIHALDTDEATAVCVDLPEVNPNNIYRLRMAVGADGGPIEVLDGDRVEALVDQRTFEVSEPASAAAADSATSGGAAEDDGGMPPAAWIVAAGALLALVSWQLARRRRPAV